MKWQENSVKQYNETKVKKNTLHQSLARARNWNTTNENAGKGNFMLWVSK